MLTTAFDISNNEPEHKFLIIAGFISYAEMWKDFDREWRTRLKEDDLAFFHMNRFAMSQGIFLGWEKRKERRIRLMGDLLGIIRGNAVRKFGILVQSDAAHSVFPSHPNYKHKMLQVAVSCIVSAVESWKAREHVPYSPEYVFEEGDPGKGVIEKTISNIVGKLPRFRAKKDNPAKDVMAFTPLQAADIFAYEVKKVFENDPRSMTPGHRFRVPYEVLNKMEEDAVVFSPDSAKAFTPYFEVDRYFKNNPLG